MLILFDNGTPRGLNSAQPGSYLEVAVPFGRRGPAR